MHAASFRVAGAVILMPSQGRGSPSFQLHPALYAEVLVFSNVGVTLLWGKSTNSVNGSVKAVQVPGFDSSSK